MVMGISPPFFSTKLHKSANKRVHDRVSERRKAQATPRVESFWRAKDQTLVI